MSAQTRLAAANIGSLFVAAVTRETGNKIIITEGK